MTSSIDAPSPPQAAPDPGSSYVRRLLHRWLVEYNPLYLLSAALVLTGTWLTSDGLSREGSDLGPLGVTAVAEIYAACLIGGAALLTRIGQRRPAVMLALITILYQWDLTLHTERAPYLAPWSSLPWVVIFAAKLYALAWAMKIRLSRSAGGALVLGGIGMAAFPALLEHLGRNDAGALLAAWVFALLSLHRTAEVTSRVPLDAWGATVLRRAVSASWLLSALLVSGHVLFWASQHAISLGMVLPVAPILLVRGQRSEARVWALSLGSLVVTGVLAPQAFSVTALLAAAALVLRALSPSPTVERHEAAARPVPPYRSSAADAQVGEPEIAVRVVPLTVDPAARNRMLVGAVFAVYLSAWSLGWSGGPWPAHVLALDVAMTVVALVAARGARVWVALAPLGATYLHLVVQAGLVPAPQSLVEWGVSAVALGFTLLAGSLAASYRLRSTATEPADDPPAA